MRSTPQATGGLLIAVACFGVPAAWGQGFPEARATINSCVDGSLVGSATLIETPSSEGIKSVTAMVSAANLSPGKHAVHIHEVGACTPCSAAASHLDLGPFGNNLPVTANHPYHSGDLINIQIGSRGTGFMTHVTNRIAVSNGPLGIFDANGAAIVIHSLPDLYCEDPSNPNCAGGGRVACGVIERVR
jgi:superoxide dismutase, Cu-Zn family